MFPVLQGSAETLTRHSGGFKRKTSSATDQLKRASTSMCWFQLPQAYFGNPWASPGGGVEEEHQTYVMQQSVSINMIAILTTSVQKQFLFIN